MLRIMKIPPITSSEPKYTFTAPLRGKCSSWGSCSITSLNPLQYFGNFFSWIFSWIQSLICCGKKQEKFKGDVKPEIDPSLLSTYDPFRCLLFNENLCFCSPDAFAKTTELFSFLGSRSYWSWIGNARYLAKMEQETKALITHPLQFLYYLLLNRELTACTLNFKSEAIRGESLLKLKSGRNPWQDFILQQAAGFDHHRSDLHQHLPGFCQLLSLDQERIEEFARDEDWEGLIEFSLESRKSHFKIR